MDRRKFLKALGLGGIASAVAPTLLLDALAPAPDPVDQIAAGLDLAPGVWPSTATGLNHWSLMDDGPLDIGVLRDVNGFAKNEFTMFMEEWVGLVRVDRENCVVT